MSITLFISLLFLLGAAASFLAGLLGLGGGILIIPGLNILFAEMGLAPGFHLKLALGTSLASVFFTALISMYSHRKFTTVNWPVAKMMIPGLLVGGLIGPLIAAHLSTRILVGFFCTLLLCLGIKFLWSKQSARGHRSLNPWIIAPCSVGLGLAASMLGLGGGVLIVPFLSRFDLELRDIVAISVVCLVPSSFVATIGYLYAGWDVANLPAYSTGYIYWLAVVPLVAASVIFAPIGVKMVHRLPQTTVRRLFGICLILIAAQMLWKAF